MWLCMYTHVLQMHAKEQAHNAGIPVIDPTSNWPADADGSVVSFEDLLCAWPSALFVFVIAIL